jgi:hypothetical protein
MQGGNAVNTAIDALPWPALALPEYEIRWDDLHVLADAAVESTLVRERLMAAADKAAHGQRGKDERDDNFADLAVPAVFALCAEQMDPEARREVAEYLLRFMYEAGVADADFALEATQSAAGALGPDILPPALRLLRGHGESLDCWFHVFGALEYALPRMGEPPAALIEFCREVVTSSPHRFEPYAGAQMAAMMLAQLGDRESLSAIKQMHERAPSAELKWSIDMLEGRPISEEDVPKWPLESPDAWLSRSIDSIRRISESDRDTPAAGVDLSRGDAWGDRPRTILREEVRVSRNDSCPCGSKKKYKKCCYGRY